MAYKQIKFLNLTTLPEILLCEWRSRSFQLDGIHVPNEKGLYIISLNLNKMNMVRTNFRKLSQFFPLYIGRGQLRNRFNNHKREKKQFYGMHDYLEFWYLTLYSDLKSIDVEDLKILESQLINAFYPVINENDEIKNKNQNDDLETETAYSDIKNFLDRDEDLNLEFKETYQLKTFFKSNIKHYVKDDEMRMECLRTICGFLNAYGGTIIIGVKEKPNKEFLGIQPDLEKIFSSDFDKMKGSIIHSVRDLMGQYASKNIRVKKEIFDKKLFCKIKVIKSSKKIFLKEKNTEIFYFRDDHGDDPVNPSEVDDIWKKRQKSL